jgi:hypothetical protein
VKLVHPDGAAHVLKKKFGVVITQLEGFTESISFWKVIKMHVNILPCVKEFEVCYSENDLVHNEDIGWKI